MTNAVVIQQLQVKTKQRMLLEINDIEIVSGNRYVIIGPSGAGKSTLLKSIASLQTYSTGEITLFEAILEKKTKQALRKRMVYVAQHEVLFTGDVAYNIGLGLKFRKVSKQERQGKIKEILALVGLEGYEKRNIDTLSGGEIQRVALARALVFEPELLLLDEPTANLDPYNVQMMEQAILNYCKVKKATLILATHNMNQAKRIGQYGLFIANGLLKEFGELPGLVETPNSPELVEFLEWA
ncbi:ABC transporter ATP-binding protein [Neobacillus vireti]|uniref:ABC transporter ATP-binding protein n=1 Tax=Neobacillus vireti TaxID=220686 RepID=UPI002FFDA36E